MNLYFATFSSLNKSIHLNPTRVQTARLKQGTLMTYYSVLAVSPTNPDWVADYIGPANALVAKHGGKYIARTASHEQLEGAGNDAALRIVIAWPSRQDALNFMSDPGYLPHLQARTAGSRSEHFLIEAKDDLA
jgi:uncharacterized protein (DUF1330 family)